MDKPFLMLLTFLGLNFTVLQAQDQVSDIYQRLDKIGFENIRLKTLGNTLVLSYENNLYRNRTGALKEILDQLSKSGYDSLKVITLVNDMPLVVSQVKVSDWKKYASGQMTVAEMSHRFKLSYNTDDSWKPLNDSSVHNPHFKKVALVFYPQFLQMNIRTDQLYELQLNIAPALEVSLWRGMKFTGQVILPLYSDKWYGKEGKKIRAGFVTLSQEFRLPGSILGRTVIGKFNAGRYGSDMSLTHYLMRGQSYVKINAGVTGEYQYYEGGWFRNNINTLTYSIKSGYYWKPNNIQIDVSANRYINSDFGMRGDFTRYWGETAIGLFAMMGINGKYYGGFHFVFAIGPKHRKNYRSLQIQSPDYFDWEYNTSTDGVFGQYYETRPNENRVEHFYNPNFILKNLAK
ncbi:MAG: YjbH domain-containing protein [Mariniphaga sp.]